MVFSSTTFWMFFALVLPLYAVLGHRAQNRMLLLASYVFYGWWDWRFLSLLWLTTAVDYVCARRIEEAADPSGRRRWLQGSIAFNLLLLGTFKYFDFFAGSLAALLGAAGMKADLPTLRLILPAGISFYTFQSMSYVIDVYRGQVPATRRLEDFALFVTYFPQLVAGPIERAANLLPRLLAPRRVTSGMLAAGALLIFVGMVKKVVLADRAAVYVDEAFAAPGSQPAEILWRAALLFPLQVYGDFSGYSDIARGVSLILGIPLMRNFAQPYFATSIRDFWRRWHISLSTWLRDYLYIPLGGNRRGRRRACLNLVVTMTLAGLWHGANWTFVLWGLLHGIYLSVHRWWTEQVFPLEARPWRRSALGALAGGALTFACVTFALVLFRSPSVEAAALYLTRMAEWPGLHALAALSPVAYYAALMLLTDLPPLAGGDDTALLTWPVLPRAAAYASMAVLLVLAGGTSNDPFIYFQF